MFIDSHFHSLIMADKGMDAGRLLKEAAEAGLRGGLDVGILPEDTERRLALTAPFPWIRLSAGIYPGGSEGLLPDLEKRLCTGMFSAVGETGIDLHWNYAPAEKQAELFIRQIELANAFRLPVVIHSRKADREVLSALRQCRPEYGGILHCFSSGYETAKSCIDLGLYISFAGNITYKHTDEVREAAVKIPADRLLLETDAPYLSPQPVRSKKNQPGFIEHTYSFTAGLRDTDQEELQRQVAKNFFTLFPSP
jgi:TatD DNase family protein